MAYSNFSHKLIVLILRNESLKDIYGQLFFLRITVESLKEKRLDQSGEKIEMEVLSF